MLSTLLKMTRRKSADAPTDLRRCELQEKFRRGISPTGSCTMTEAELLELVELEAEAARGHS